MIKKNTKKPARNATPARQPNSSHGGGHSVAGGEKQIGEVIHFFSNIKVAVIKLSAPLSVGDTIHIVGGKDTDFEQPVKSMQVDHDKIEKAKKGSEVGLKVKKKVREGYSVFKI